MGVATRSMLKRKKWATRKALCMKRVHRIFAYTVIVLATGAIFTGILSYRTNPKHPIDFPLEYVALAIFIIILFILEL